MAPTAIPETWAEFKTQGSLVTESFALGRGAADIREATSDAALVDAFTVTAVAAAQAIANMNGDNDVKEHVRHMNPDQRQAWVWCRACSVWACPKPLPLLFKSFLKNETWYRTDIASEFGESPRHYSTK